MTALTVETIAENREKIMRFEHALLAQNSGIELETIHHFSPGVYARELRIPAGVMLTGKIHKTRHLNIISSGKIRVFCPLKGTFDVTAPCTFVSEPGTKRAGIAITDTVWTTIHPTDETDIDKIESLVIAESFDDPALLEYCRDGSTEDKLCLGQQQ